MNYVLPPGTNSNKGMGIRFPEISKLQWESIESISLEYQGGLGHCSFLITDRDGEYFGYKKRYMLGRDKWTTYTAYFTDPDGKSYHNWGGNSKRNGIMDPPLRLASLSITIYPSYIAGQLRGTLHAGLTLTAEEVAKGMNPVDILLSSIKIKGVKYDSSKQQETISVLPKKKNEGVTFQFREIGTIAPLRQGNTEKLKYILTNTNDTESSVKVSASSKLALTQESEQKYEQTISLKAGESREIELPFDYSRPGFYDISLNLSTGKNFRTFVSTWEPIGNDWEDDPETFFGTQMVMDLHQRIFTPHRDQDFKNMRDAGVKLLRFTIRWSAIQPQENGPMNWKTYDAAVKKCREYGIIPYLMIANAPKWAAADKKAAAEAPKFVQTCHPDNKLYAQFAATVAERYRNSTNYFQIWNEPYA
ncbi:MAG: cellulase family glycosylhydrolase, partial [Lentisphaeria bacterium]|nr:cellulase family glycosylhydrolase [Lentisphaeria bacterium]